MSLYNINPCCFQRLNTRRTICHRRGGAATGDNQVPPQAPSEGVAMMVNPTWLTDVEVRAYLAHMLKDIAMHAQSMNQVNRKNVQRENPPVRRWADRLRDFTRMNPPIFIGSNTLLDP